MAQYDPIKKSSESIASLDSLCAALDISRKDLDAALELPGEDRYSQNFLDKKDGSKRTVYNPHYLIRKIQRRINKRIFSNESIIKWPDHIFGSIPNQKNDDDELITKDYISCARLHCASKSILTLDIKDFFDNIHQIYVEEVFRDFLKYSEDVSLALANICCLDSHLVQGALTSSYIASLVLFDIEGETIRKLERKKLVYTRLVDDINISSKVSDYNFSYAKNLVEEMLTTKGLPVNPDKTAIQYVSSKPLTVHGLRVAFNEPRLPADEVRRIRAAVKNIETLAQEASYKTTHSYRKDFNRCMGRVNKLKRVGHNQHTPLSARLIKVLPLPSKKDLDRVEIIVKRLEADSSTKRDTYWYWRRFYLAHERLTILNRSFPRVTSELRARLRPLRPKYD
ncbi:MAG: reverse transcriptase family protein [Polynucleobacter sp.]|nr:reverse transcriptase family protein [Polynucleobacter sp.]